MSEQWTWSPAQLDRLRDFLDEHDVLHGSLTLRPIGDGHSNLTYLVTDGEREVVLRRPPPPPTPPGAHDMLREAQLIGALEGSEVPVARVLAVAQRDDVIDVPFYVMTYVRGPVATTGSPPHLANPAERRRVGESLVATLAALHAVDWRAAGLENMGKPKGFNLRHVKRMAALVADDDGNPPDDFAPVDAWLRANAPAESGEAIIHNDFRLGNVILGPDTPGRVVAVLDWELATIGDPLFDLGYFLSSYPVAGEERTPTEDLGTSLLEDGYPTRDEIAAMYAARTGADLSALPWYVAMAQWKLAVLYEYGHRRAIAGVGDPYYADRGLVVSFLRAAHRAAGLPWSRGTSASSS
ncbi:MAG: phosphotransferase family protein [Tetrasphaera sp.]